MFTWMRCCMMKTFVRVNNYFTFIDWLNHRQEFEWTAAHASGSDSAAASDAVCLSQTPKRSFTHKNTINTTASLVISHIEITFPLSGSRLAPLYHWLRRDETPRSNQDLGCTGLLQLYVIYICKTFTSIITLTCKFDLNFHILNHFAKNVKWSRFEMHPVRKQ